MPLTSPQERKAATTDLTGQHYPATATSRPLRVSIDKPTWTRLWDQTGIPTDYQRAAAMGTSQGTYSLVVRGERPPTIEFLARARQALRRITQTEVDIDDLIDVAETT